MVNGHGQLFLLLATTLQVIRAAHLSTQYGQEAPCQWLIKSTTIPVLQFP